MPRTVGPEAHHVLQIGPAFDDGAKPRVHRAGPAGPIAIDVVVDVALQGHIVLLGKRRKGGHAGEDQEEAGGHGGTAGRRR